MQIIGLRNHFVSKGTFAGCCANLRLSYFHIMILVNSWPDGLEQLPPMPGKSLCLRRQNSSFVWNSFLKVHKGNFSTLWITSIRATFSLKDHSSLCYLETNKKVCTFFSAVLKFVPRRDKFLFRLSFKKCSLVAIPFKLLRKVVTGRNPLK